MELTGLRNEINQIDKELVDLFLRRMNVSARVAEYKREHNMAVWDPARERELLEKISRLSGEEYEEYARTLYGTILSLSRSHQYQRLGIDSPLYQEIADAIENTPKIFPERASVACQGVEGAYSQLATERLFRAPDICFFSNWERCLMQLNRVCAAMA